MVIPKNNEQLSVFIQNNFRSFAINDFMLYWFGYVHILHLKRRPDGRYRNHR